MTRADFRQQANALTATIEGQAAAVQVTPKDDGMGPRWHGSGSVFVYIDGKPERCTMTVRITPENGRNWPER